MKKIVVALMVLLFSSSVHSAGWGVITENTDAEIGELEKDYRLGLVNTGDEPVTVNFDASDSSDYSIEFDDSRIRLEPSYTSKSPQGSDWFYAGNGEYVNVTYTGFTFAADKERSSNNLNFSITASAGRETNPMNKKVPQQSLISQRSFEYGVKIDKTLVNGLNSEEDSIWADSEESSSSSQQSGEAEVNEESEQNFSQSERRENDLDEEGEGVNITTLILTALLVSTVAYILY